MTTALHVWRATAADLDQLATLFDGYRQFYNQPPDLALARDFVAARVGSGESVVFLAGPERQTAVGFVQLYPSFSSVSARRIWILNDLFVRADSRQTGVGRALLEAARQLAVETGAKRLVLQTATTNVRAQRLYEAVGYVRDEGFLTYEFEV